MADYGLRDAELRAQGLFAAEGRLLVERAFEAGLEVVRLFADRAAADEARALFPGSLILDAEGLSREAGYPFHRGMLAHVRRPALLGAQGEDSSAAAGSAEAVSSATAADTTADTTSVPNTLPSGLSLALPKITDPGNLGTLLRSALAFGFETVLLGPECLDPFNRKALRASMGASYRLRLVSGGSEVLGEWKKGGVEPVAAALEPGAEPIDEWAPRGKAGTCLVLGNEHDGIPAPWRAQCRRAVMIPVSGLVDSLNVAVAGSILMRELNRRALP